MQSSNSCGNILLPTHACVVNQNSFRIYVLDTVWCHNTLTWKPNTPHAIALTWKPNTPHAIAHPHAAVLTCGERCILSRVTSYRSSFAVVDLEPMQ